MSEQDELEKKSKKKGLVVKDKKQQATDVFVADFSETVSLANKKGLAKIEHIPTRIARYGSLIANAEIQKQISRMYEVFGGDPKGMAIQFNVKIKEYFGFSVTNEMTEAQAQAITNARITAARVCDDGLEHGLSKNAIIAKIWIVIKHIADSHKQIEALLR